jgi:hypothetical protein
MKKFRKKTHETHERHETHMAIFCIPLISLTLRKGMGKIKEIPETHERHETHETPIVILFSFPVGEESSTGNKKKAHLWKSGL